MTESLFRHFSIRVHENHNGPKQTTAVPCYYNTTQKNLHNTEKILVLIKYGYDYDNRQTVIIINKQNSLKETNAESLL